ncbi:hypothetical protein SAMN05518863_11321 [Candidatus Pantoea symbiotica]|jgi:hypothetical protein|uniref:Bacterial Ig-like domain-containing protein n=1 Tax=Candidatus Pantoea symbiotica TaxID=1884370 RepID=A0A1I4DP13_9GAMM|nr:MULTISPECIES: Ig-like domain-containing protein [Pantoea]KAJ9432030.1 Ig-like domain-containing protein [Pantoea sp. YR343]MRT24197.1 hypothetical protein [Enterobacteriaceae bacterium RIT697]SFK94027.1 hypothetical protein SAMN05518863_11321 [Pantoea symbiotica]SFV05708.1 hypothetical protein SAMN05518864_11321 [Pantoea sp. YR525]
MAYTNGYKYSGYYQTQFGWKPYIPNGTVYLDDISHKVDSLWSSINPGAVDNTGTLSLSGFANGYKKIEIYDNGKLIKTVESNKLGVWVADLSDVLNAGSHNFTIKQEGFGFSGGEPIHIVVQGNNGPIPVEITQVYDDVGIHKGIIEQGKTTDDSHPTFSGKGPANSLVTLVNESNNVIAHGYSDNYGNWKITPEFDIADGSHNIRAFVNGKFSSDFNITIDTAPAQYPVTFTGAFDYLTASTIPENGVTSDSRPGFSGEASPNSYVYLFIEGSNEPIGGSVTNGFGKWTITPFKDLAAGTHTFEVRVNGETAKYTLTIGADSSIEQPLVIDHLIDGQSFDIIPENGQSSDTTPWISGKSEPFANVVLLEGSKFIGYAQADASGKWIYEISSELEAGQHLLTAHSNNQVSEPFAFSIAAPQASGGYWGWGSFSVNAVTDVYDTNDQPEIAAGKAFNQFSLNELLINEEASLFAEISEQQEAPALILTQAELSTESLSTGVELNSDSFTSSITEEPQYAQYA